MIDRKKCIDLADKILKWTGIPVSIGIAKTKTLAKIANRVVKKKKEYSRLNFNYKNILEVKKDSDLEYILHNTNVQDVWELGKSCQFSLTKII